MNPRVPNANPPEIPPDVEARYQEIQAELQQLEISPEATAGETREARFARRQRIRALRREFDSMSRVPLARRQRTGYTVLAMFGLAVMLCVLSVGGGMLLANQLNKPPDISGTATSFLNDVKASNYDDAFGYLSRGFTPIDFKQEGDDADTSLGPVTKYTFVTQHGGGSGDTSGTATYEIYRAGGSQTNGKPTPPYSVVLSFNYSSNNGWQISFYDNLFSYDPTKGK